MYSTVDTPKQVIGIQFIKINGGGCISKVKNETASSLTSILCTSSLTILNTNFLGLSRSFPALKKVGERHAKKNDLKISIIQGTKINIYITILTLTLNFVMFHFVTLTFILVENNTIRPSLINVIV